MAEIIFSEEKKVSNVTVKGQDITITGEIVYSGTKVERAALGIQDNQEGNRYVGDVSLVDNHDERGSVSCYICCPPKYVLETTTVAGDLFNQLLTPSTTK